MNGLTRSHLYASDLLAVAKRLRSEADDAAWNLDFDIADDLNAKADGLCRQANLLLAKPDEAYPLF